MKVLPVIAALALSAGFVGAASAQQDRDHRAWGEEQQNDHQWKRGEHMGHDNWQNAQHVDYREHHLRQPPRGYEWRQSNGQYILAAIATGAIASIILSHGR